MKCSYFLTAFLVVLISLSPCVAIAKAKVPTLQLTQYGLVSGPTQSQTKSDVEIGLTVIRVPDIYQYSDLFSFKIEDLPQFMNLIPSLTSRYPEDHSGRSWLNPFITEDGTKQLLLCQVKVKNGADHILQMGDARIYLIIEGRENPISALASFDHLLKTVDYFEGLDNQYLSQQGGKKILGGFLRIKVVNPIPAGFYRAFVFHHQESFNLINSLKKEILPGFSYKGMLAFAVFATAGPIDSPAKISFFNIITKTDAAGNPVEKTQFDFPLQPQKIDMWYDKEEKMWKEGAPPE